MQVFHMKCFRSDFFRSGLWIPASIVFIGFALSLIFVFWALSHYKKPTPLIIKPSSIEHPTEAARALERALQPLFLQNYGVHTSQEEDSFSKAFNNYFATQNLTANKFLNIKFFPIDLSQPHNVSQIDCYQSALFNLKRKKERKWNKKYYFVLCEADKTELELYYTHSNNPK